MGSVIVGLMNTNRHPDDMPPENWRRFTSSEEASGALPEESDKNPVSVGMMFCNGLGDVQEWRPLLDYFVTPESRPHWGDFTEAASVLAAIEDRGYGSFVEEAVGDPGVRYFKILRGIDRSFQVTDDQVLMMGAILTLVWRPDHDRWMVHGIGEYIKPEEVPH